ncbi:MAG: hypothetical protein S4CHLAM6_04070 [Chlamydiae bacterium]|nr:hypothetical protein [Chlamydiota bacterium]
MNIYPYRYNHHQNYHGPLHNQNYIPESPENLSTQSAQLSEFINEAREHLLEVLELVIHELHFMANYVESEMLALAEISDLEYAQCLDMASSTKAYFISLIDVANAEAQKIKSADQSMQNRDPQELIESLTESNNLFEELLDVRESEAMGTSEKIAEIHHAIAYSLKLIQSLEENS